MRWSICFAALTLALAGWAGVEASLPEEADGASFDVPRLETYAFELAGWPQVELAFLDPRIANGAAQFRFEIKPVGRGASRLRLEIFRHVPPDSVQFALLLEEVRLDFFDAAGETVKTIRLDEVLGDGGLFILGDSADGYYQYRGTVSGLERAARLEIRLFGNYE